VADTSATATTTGCVRACLIPLCFWFAAPVAENPLPHATASFFHIFFRAATVVFYMFSTWFTDNFVLVFVTCVLLCAADFW
jgi:hypothetical protein